MTKHAQPQRPLAVVSKPTGGGGKLRVEPSISVLEDGSMTLTFRPELLESLSGDELSMSSTGKSRTSVFIAPAGLTVERDEGATDFTIRINIDAKANEAAKVTFARR